MIAAMTVPLKLNITTGDKITSKEVVYHFKLLLEGRSNQSTNRKGCHIQGWKYKVTNGTYGTYKDKKLIEEYKFL